MGTSLKNIFLYIFVLIVFSTLVIAVSNLDYTWNFDSGRFDAIISLNQTGGTDDFIDRHGDVLQKIWNQTGNSIIPKNATIVNIENLSVNNVRPKEENITIWL